MARQPRDKRHLYIEGRVETEHYTTPRRGQSKRPPIRNRGEHAALLEASVTEALHRGRERNATRDDNITHGEPGYYLQFELPAEAKGSVENLENKTNKIELLSVRQSFENNESYVATVFVPQDAADFYSGKIVSYRDDDTPSGNPKFSNLINAIDDIALADVRSIYTGSIDLFPDDQVSVWWEVWTRKGKKSDLTEMFETLNVLVKEHIIEFPEREVLLAYCSPATLNSVITNSDGIAELRVSTDSPRIFLEFNRVEQQAWTDDLLNHLVAPHDNSPFICILDSGATRDHPLLEPFISINDQFSYDPAWGVGDTRYWAGHGTLMAGSAIYGDLYEKLIVNNDTQINHRLETVKILPNTGQNTDLYGAIMEISVQLVEEANDDRLRIFCLAVTSQVGLEFGRPSAWSATIDKLAYNDGHSQRLFVIAAGNIRDNVVADEYPDRNDLEQVESPAQSWNSIVAGYYTEKQNITDPTFVGWDPIADVGDLGPTSRTSAAWERQWPIRPDVVLEGGNWAHDGVNPPDPIDDLQLISTHHDCLTSAPMEQTSGIA